MAPFYAYVIILGGKKIIPLSLSGDQKNLVTIRQWGYVKWQLKFFHCQKGGVHVRSFFNLKKSSPTRPPPPMPSQVTENFSHHPIRGGGGRGCWMAFEFFQSPSDTPPLSNGKQKGGMSKKYDTPPSMATKKFRLQ